MEKKLTVLEVYNKVAEKAESIIREYALYSGNDTIRREAVKNTLYYVMELLEQTEELNKTK